MQIEYFGSKFDIPDLLINKFAKDFDSLPGSGHREGVQQLRDCIDEILDVVVQEPDILNEPEYKTDFLKALAMRQAMNSLGILYDS
jgi:hypothetical protein